MKTIKMLADELNVTKQTIVNNAKSLNIIFEKENGINYINEDECLKIVNKITKKENTTKSKVSNSKETPTESVTKFKNLEDSNLNSSDTLKTKVNELEKQIEIFEARSKNYEKYIEYLTKQLDQQNSNVNTLNKLLENQQILTLESNKKIQKLENQLEKEKQLNYSFDPSTNDRQNVNAQEVKFTEKVKNVSQQNENKTAEDVGDKNKKVPGESKKKGLEEDELLKYNNQSQKIKTNHDDKVEQPPKKGFWSRLFGN
ncbi:DUF536 domain-containing protein (plasmid) [Staphylococcus epidermidis]|uniref:DUF536 domain-containing protein n=1 Tax=Staphylococcus epidermidis TaxID=1282 RepID=UPI0024ADC6D5|nr:DUF536 domain-containing protein [Staphylococcus epidermidis]WHI82624.1 DUF536 domain-containing protein [Staphylococcus epidermidis]